MSIFEATVEGDVEIVISALKDGSTSNPEFGHIIQDSLVLANDLRLCIFSHVKRLANELQVWIEFIPNDIALLVHRDSVVFSSFLIKLTFGSGFFKNKKIKITFS